MTPRVLLIGAYERDNVGDLLFLEVTERYLRDADVIAAAPFPADMTALLDRYVPAYGPLLETQDFDAIWTVGGQVGAIDAGRAHRLSVPAPERGGPLRRRAVLHGLREHPAPYIPSSGQRNRHALRIVNSAGLSGIRHVPRPRHDALVGLLRRQDHIAVRDTASRKLMDQLRIDNALVPDAVHALRVLRPSEPDPQSDTAIVQVSSSILDALGHERVARALGASRRLRRMRLRFLLAGTAPGHDSAADYERVIDALPAGIDAAVLYERRPLKIADQIAAARVVLGTSLHVRVLAAAGGVARVSLARPKTTRYAQTWDARMPFDVELGDLDDAVRVAMRRAGRPAAVAHADALARHADEHLSRLAERVLDRAPLAVSYS